VRFCPDVAELEAGVVVARVLVVDQPDPVAVVDEVGRQQVVVARNRALPAGSGQGRPRLIEVRRQAVVAGRDPEAAGLRRGQVPPLDGEHVEVVAEPAAAVQQAAGLGDARDVAGRRDVRAAERPALDVADDEQAVLRAVLDDRRPRPGGGRVHRVAVLAVPVDREQFAARAGDTRDITASRRRHVIVAVGQPAGQFADRTGCASQAFCSVEEGVEVRADHLLPQLRSGP
jgi:hypothetical protein